MSRCLLVVDDEPDIIDGIAWALEPSWAVDAAGDGHAALACLETGHYAAALVDWNLPDINGGEVVRHLRSERPELPVILVSAAVDVDLFAKDIGADAWLRKPFELEHLESTLERVTARARSA